MQFAKVLVALAAGAAAFTAPTASKVSKVVVRGENPNEDGKLGAGGMADTRDPEPFVNETDKRQSISQAPSFGSTSSRASRRDLEKGSPGGGVGACTLQSPAPSFPPLIMN